jgi:hypothetical protein
MPKNIVVLSDGTGQEGGKGHDTNIYKLFRMLEDRTERQVVFYDEGLGTDYRKFTGNAFGAGFSKNLLQCYQFIFDNYNAGDKIYLFGFSRGAATVRSLASFIHYFGILPKSRPELIEKAYKLYRRGQDKVGSGLLKSSQEREDILNEKANEFIHEHPNQWAEIEFLGVWDTVPAIGLVAVAGLNSFLGKLFKYNFHDFKLHPSIKNAYHALSIDDDRLWFHPSLLIEKTREDQIVEQVWFSGAHTDIGGGFDESGLSDVALEWMVEKAVSYGLRLYLGSRKHWNFVVAPDPTDRFHPPREGFGRIFVEGKRNDVWNKQGAEAEFGPPIIHKSVLDRCKKSRDENDRNPWILKKASRRLSDSQDAEFKEFLRRKFYEYLKFEWKKYDWEKDQHQSRITFDKWIQQSKYDKYFASYDWNLLKEYMEDEYEKYCEACRLDKKKPEARGEWMKNNPYRNDKNRDQNWLEEYEFYQEWLETHTEEHEGLIYYVEPVRKLDDFECPVDRQMRLRDYDEETWQEIFEFDGESLIVSDERRFENLEERGKWDDNRLSRDLTRWRERENDQ